MFVLRKRGCAKLNFSNADEVVGGLAALGVPYDRRKEIGIIASLMSPADEINLFPDLTITYKV